MSAESRYWAGHPAAGLLRGSGIAEETVTASGLRLARTHGTCMWPGLRGGDLVFYAPLLEGPLAGLLGSIAVARSPKGPVAHRIRRIFGAAGHEWLVLAGDLSEPDSPRSRRDVLGVAKAVYRPGHGFVDLPARLEVGPISGALLGRLARFFTWAERVA